MVSVLKYARINAKVKGMRSRLLRKEDLYALLGAKNLKGVVRLLSETPYGRRVKEVGEKSFNALNLERALIKSFLDDVYLIMREAPSDARELLEHVLEKLETHNLKLVLRAKEAGLPKKQVLSGLMPLRRFGLRTCELLMDKSESIEDIINLLEGTAYGEVLSSFIGDYRLLGSLLPLENALDKYVYWRIMDRAKRLRGINGKIAREIFGSEIDVLNIKTTIRCKRLNLDVKRFVNYILPSGLVFEEKDILEAYSKPSIQETFRFFQVYEYTEAIEKGLRIFEREGTLLPLEVELERLLAKVNKNICLKYPSPFHIGIILCYVNLKWFELRNLRTIISGKELGVQASTIERLLILER